MDVAPAADVAILGAGPAGLAAAWRAASAGLNVAVFERGPSVGGLAASFEVADVRVDHGSHRLHPSTDPAILQALQDLLGDDLQRRSRNGRIRLEGSWIAFPLRGGDLVRHLPPGFAASVLVDMVTAPLRRPREDTFTEVVRARLGRTMAERFYDPYARKIWGVEPDALAGEQARRRISAASPWQVAAGALRRSEPKTFFYPRRGFGQISEALAEAAVSAGAELRLNAPVSEVRLDSNEITVIADAPLHVRQVWSTIPLPVLARLVAPQPPAAVLTAAAALRSRALTLVYLVLPVDRWTPYDAHYLPSGDTPVSRVSEPKNYRDGDDPRDRTVLCAEVPCDVGDTIWGAADEDLGGLVAEGLARAGLPPVDHVDVVVRRVASAYPIYSVGYEAAFAMLDQWANSQPALLTFGRQGLFAHDNSDHTMSMAWAAVDAWDGARVDPARWAQARERFRSHVVED